MGIRRLVQRHRHFLVLCAVFWVIVRLHMVVIAPFEGPDEAEHLAYIVHLHQTGQYPTYNDINTTPIRQQVGQPPLYYTLVALLTLPYNFADVDVSQVRVNPWHGYPAPPTSTDNRNYAIMHPDFQHLTPEQARLSETLTYTRAYSVAFGWLALLGVYWGGLTLWQDRRWALLAASLLGFAPPVLQVFAVVTNDAAVLAFSALSLAGALNLFRHWDSWRWLVGVGVLLALAALAKVSGLVLFAVVGLAVIAGWWRARSQGTGDAPGLPALIRSALILGGVAGLLAGWWYLRGYLLYGDPLGTQPHQQMEWGFSELQPISMAVARLPVIWGTLWFNAGWGELRPPDWYYAFPYAVLLVAIIGGVRRFRRPEPRALLLLLTLGLGVAALIRWMQTSDLITGRLYLPYAPALALLVVWGIRSAPLARLWRTTFSGLAGGLAIISAVVVIYPALTAPHLLDQPPADLLGEPIRFGALRFIGYRIDSDTLRAGEERTLTLCWQADDAPEPIPVPYPFAVQAITITSRDPLQVAEPIVARRESFPGLGKYTLWQAGRAFCDTFGFPVTGELNPGEEYALYLTLFDLETTFGLMGMTDGGAPSSKVIGYVRAG